MQGIEISKAFWEQYGRPAIEAELPGLMPLIAAGLTGSGSECCGWDDSLSRDHDFEPGFCLFLPEESVVNRPTAFKLERLYAHLPKEFMGLTRSGASTDRRGVIRISEYFQNKVGSADGILTVGQWMSLPEHALSEAVNGEIFYDDFGEVTRIRRRLRRYPSDVRLKKLAGHMMLMSQSGLYNYPRCLARNETGAAQLAVVEFSSHATAAVFLLNETYRPFYKWQFRAFRSLPRLPMLAELMEYLISSGNEEGEVSEKEKVMADIARDIMAEATFQGLSHADQPLLEKHAMSINDSIADSELRNMNLLSGV